MRGTKDVIDARWKTSSKTTKCNVRSCLKRALGYINMTEKGSVREFLEHCEDVEAFTDKIWAGKDPLNTSKKVVALLNHLEKRELSNEYYLIQLDREQQTEL